MSEQLDELVEQKNSFLSASDYQTLESQLQPNETELSPESIEAIAAKFGYRTEVDQDGLTRQVYEFGGASFSFASREETPIYPTVEQSQPTRLGREPWRSGSLNHREHYKEQIDRQTNYDSTLASLRERNADKPEHFITETSPYGVYSLLAKLQQDNPTWQIQAKAIAQGQYDQEALNTIDMITALNAYYIGNREDAEHQPLLGELVVVAALLGDQQAQQLADQATRLQRQREEAVIDRNNAAMSSREALTDAVEAFKPSDLVVVHATSYEPKQVEGGHEVSTTHDASGFPRATIHTSLNHKVESAGMYGEWDSNDYVIISGLDAMLQADGLPKSLNGADTWWTRDPGEALSFPDATLIMPGGEQDELAIKADHGRITYKSEGFTQSDIDAADDVYPGTTAKIKEALHDKEGKIISPETTQGKRIIANIVRDALVAREIEITRGKDIENQYDDKYMPPAFNSRIRKMIHDMNIPIGVALHADSEEAEAERSVSRGEYRFKTDDPKVRRVSYASGFTSGGGDARKVYIKQKNMRKMPGA